MKIQDSSVQLTASHEASHAQTLEITTEQSFRRLFERLSAAPSDEQAVARQRVQKLLQSLIDAILAAMDGKKCGENFAAGEALPPSSNAALPQPESHWQQTISETITESEKTTVCGSGQVNTCDGRSINFDFSLEMARDYHSQKTQTESGSINLRDPLILSFEGKSSQLTESRIAFDLNADGTPEEIPGLGAGCGFLVFDRNQNGKADDGSELFGVASGNGFSDLAQLDGDQNGWIDEADPAFSQLAVWSGDRFSSLKERGVGALYTAAVDAPFSIKTNSNQLLGEIRAAGIYLSEAGEVGQLQQVDLAVSDLSSGTQLPGKREQLAT